MRLGAKWRKLASAGALNQTTTYDAYTAHDQVTQMTDANNMVTQLAYAAFQRLTQRCANGLLPYCMGGELTTFEY
ncbi:MAG: hypothetical protein IPG25_13580 [Proteobacteria bacterium]|nr:hypothetical protein [Pseudomonadota bacterium]